MINNFWRSTLQLLEDFDQKKLKFNPEIPEPSNHLKSVKKRKAPKNLFQNGELDLEDLKLQEICDNVLSEVNFEEEVTTKEPPRKRLKNIEGDDLDFFASFKVDDDDGTDDDSVSSLKDYTSALVDAK